MVDFNSFPITKWALPLRVALFAFAIIALGLTAKLHAIGYSLDRINLGIASSTITLVFSVFLAIYGLFRPWPRYEAYLIVVDFIDFVLLLASAGSITEIRPVCRIIESYGFPGQCGRWRAAEAFFYLSWIVLIPLLWSDYQSYRDSQSVTTPPVTDPEAHIETSLGDKHSTEAEPTVTAEEPNPTTADLPPPADRPSA